jgi:hypothetical protein
VRPLIRSLAFTLLLLGLMPGVARAAGNAHVVDDSEVETPGTCHLELWTTVFLLGDGYGNAAPACTMLKMPWLEIGADYSHYWDEAVGAPLVGPQMKINFRSETQGLGLGLALNASVNATTGEFALGQILALVTVPVTRQVRFNFNTGWSYLNNVPEPHAVFYGAQFEADLTKEFMLMIEVFGRNPGVAGGQIGLRYTPGQGRIDFDLIAGSFLDGPGTRTVTVGVTLRY